jgi:hypothetical protein
MGSVAVQAPTLQGSKSTPFQFECELQNCVSGELATPGILQ